MNLPFSISRLTWVPHNHFADFESRPERERRLTWKDKDDDERPPLTVFRGDREDDELTERERFAKEYNVTLKSLSTPIDTKKILNTLDVTGESLRKVISNKSNRDDILRAVWEETHSERTVQIIMKMIDEETASPAHIRGEILKHLIPAEQEKTKEQVRNIMKQKPNEKETESKEKRKSFIKQVFRGVGPMHGRLLRFCDNNADAPSFDEITENLQDPGKRLETLQNLASLRHDLFFQNTENIGGRIQALEDLAGFLGYAQYLLSEDERIAFLDAYTRVRANENALRAYAISITKEKSGDGETDDRKK